MLTENLRSYDESETCKSRFPPTCSYVLSLVLILCLRLPFHVQVLAYLPTSNFHLCPFAVWNNIELQALVSVPDVRAREVAGAFRGEVRRWGCLLPLQVSGNQAATSPKLTKEGWSQKAHADVMTESRKGKLNYSHTQAIQRQS